MGGGGDLVACFETQTFLSYRAWSVKTGGLCYNRHSNRDIKILLTEPNGVTRQTVTWSTSAVVFFSRQLSLCSRSSSTIVIKRDAVQFPTLPVGGSHKLRVEVKNIGDQACQVCTVTVRKV